MKTSSKRVAILGAVAAVLAMVLTACGSSSDSTGTAKDSGSNSAPSPGSDSQSSSADDSPAYVDFREAEPGSGDGMKLGLISLDDSIPFSKLVTDSVKAQAKKAGADLVVCDSKLDAAKALACAKNFKTQGVQGYLNFQPVSDAAESICAAGPQDVPVIAIDIAQGSCQTAFMGANNRRAGEIAGTGLGKFMKSKFDCKYDAYISLEDKGVGEVNDARMGGMRSGFEKVCGPVKNERVLDAGRQDIALTKFADVLTALPDAKRIVVVGINDDSVLGALASARTAGRADQLYMSGMGADPSAHCQIANNPNWAGDAAFFPEKYGEIGIPYLIDLVKGKTDVPKDLYVNHVFVNADNIDKYYTPKGC